MATQGSKRGSVLSFDLGAVSKAVVLHDGQDRAGGEAPAALVREEWLGLIIAASRRGFREVGHPLPDRLRATCSWPSTSALSHSKRTLGECWPASASADGTVEIFISPCVDESIDVAEIVLVQLVHATGATGHRGKFPAIAKTIGLGKPWRAARALPELRTRLCELIAAIGPYPHASVDATLLPHTKDTTRMQKLICPVHGYTVRTTAKWIRFGLPLCPCGLQLGRPMRSKSSWGFEPNRIV